MEQIVGALAFAVRCERERGLRARHRAAETRNRYGTAIAIGHSTTNGLATTMSTTAKAKFAKAIIG